MEITFSNTPLQQAELGVLAAYIPDVTQLPASLAGLDEHLSGALTREIEGGRLRPGKGDMVLVTGAATGPRRVLLIGEGTTYDGIDDAIRVVGGRMSGIARSQRAIHAGIVAPEGDNAAHVLALLTEGFTLGAYRYDRHKSKSSAATGKPALVSSLEVIGADEAAQTAANRAIIIARATNFARDLANAPGNLLTPDKLADAAEQLAAEHEHLHFHALDHVEIEEAGMGLIAAVAQGSTHEPRMIVLEWNPPGDTRPDSDRLALIGKAVTFDTGGISIKPSGGMTEMKMDKAGGCAVIGAMKAIADLEIQHRVLAIVSSAENMPGGEAYKPGDVITAMDGTTVEVTNTDAEGRLVLGDAISYAHKLGCAKIVEISTLTGAMVIALGNHFAGVVARPGELTETILSCAADSGDLAWHLPMHDAYKSQLKSECADMVNSGGRGGGSLYAGLFLEHFAKDTPFVHLDVAGTAMLPKSDRYHLAKGASGWGVRLFTELADRS